MMATIAHSSPAPKGRLFVVWEDGKTDVQAEFARLAGAGGVQLEDMALTVRWLSEGEAPPPQEQNRWPGEGEETMNIGAGHAEA